VFFDFNNIYSDTFFFSLGKKEITNLSCIECMKLTSQVECLKTKIISLQDELLLAQKEIIRYKSLVTSCLDDNDNKE
jgi:hypothetical protein